MNGHVKYQNKCTAQVIIYIAFKVLKWLCSLYIRSYLIVTTFILSMHVWACRTQNYSLCIQQKLWTVEKAIQCWAWFATPSSVAASSIPHSCLPTHQYLLNLTELCSCSRAGSPYSFPDLGIFATDFVPQLTCFHVSCFLSLALVKNKREEGGETVWAIALFHLQRQSRGKQLSHLLQFWTSRCLGLWSDHAQLQYQLHMSFYINLGQSYNQPKC